MAENKKPLVRMCCVCRERKDVNYFVRVSREKVQVEHKKGGSDGKGEYSYSIGTPNGRGAHVCIACIEKCVKTRALNRSFKTNVPQEIYDALLKGTAVKNVRK